MEIKATLLEQIQKYLCAIAKVENYNRSFNSIKKESKLFQFITNTRNSYWIRALKDKYDGK